MSDHGLAGIVLVPNDPGRPIICCECGEIASGADGETWVLTVEDDGTVSASPSFDWEGHFHVTADHAKQWRNVAEFWDSRR